MPIFFKKLPLAFESQISASNKPQAVTNALFQRRHYPVAEGTFINQGAPCP